MQLMRPRRLREALDFARRQGQKEKRRVTSNFYCRAPGVELSKWDAEAAQASLKSHLLLAVSGLKV